jgi:uncharacterized protein (DUF1697 family)
VTAYIALLRAINVGGNRAIRMADLVDVFVAQGCGDVRTYIQSGNVVFTDRGRAEPTLVDDLQRSIEQATGFDVPVILRSADEWAGVLDQNPYPGLEPTKLHVAFLAEAPAAAMVAKVGPDAFSPEQYLVAGRDVYLHLPNGMGQSKLARALGRTLLCSPATTRNWRTIEILRGLVEG